MVIDVPCLPPLVLRPHDIQLTMKELRVEQRDNLLARPHDFGERPYRMNRWLPFAPLTGLIGTMIAILIYPPLDRSFFWIALVLFLPSVFLSRYIQIKQKRGDDVSSFFPLTNWLAFGPLCVAAVLLANGTLDHSSIELHPGVVTRKLVSRGKSNSYYFETPSWRSNGSFEKLQVSYRLYTQFQLNDPIIVEVHRGALGIPWLGAIRKKP
jgi:hypothetical protein